MGPARAVGMADVAVKQADGYGGMLLVRTQRHAGHSMC